MHSEEKIKSLIRKYISGQYTAQELEEIRDVIAKPDVQQLFDEVLEEQGTDLIPDKDMDQPHLDDKLKLFYQKLDQQSLNEEAAPVSTPQIVPMFKRRYLRHVAIWTVFVLGAAVYGITRLRKASVKEQIVYHEQINPLGRRSKIVLPDSSEVYLGAGSRLYYPDTFASDTREISLEGEAFFQVTKNPRKPFIIHTGTVQTRVLGTSFKIDAFKNEPVSVAVATGKVRVDDVRGGKIRSLAVLMPGNMVTYTNERAATSAVLATEVSGWKDALLSFHNRTLRDITSVLERSYNVKVLYSKPAIANKKISVALQADMPLNKIMKVLAATAHFDFIISGQQVNIN
ncbi:FecR family protein [Mucilaginibacter pocheonensis]|uniref:Ferric-dicitrate binding protein FerR (Iron transport regulator) n=1 Tax=Mucilaginibacter pocheonensis TaxID=398050 RepID=A0ABU1TFP1_9SPHI|nr:FecR domain-containing protein [Mucilaginibacter pocheonensis]MDR6944227.1 ferric-dicitrate binding protein FerR (iron transport regulator) [Mucilaginibacter pocheonensis]